MSRAAEATSERVAKAKGQPNDMFEEMVSATFQVIADVTLSGDSEFDRDSVHRAIDDYILAAGRVTLADMFNLPAWVPRGGWLKSRRALKQMHSIADATIEARRSDPNSGTPDLLDLLLMAEDAETGRSMSTAELRDNLLTFIVAGHETTALTLSWALYLCALTSPSSSALGTRPQPFLGLALQRKTTSPPFPLPAPLSKKRGAYIPLRQCSL